MKLNFGAKELTELETNQIVSSAMKKNDHPTSPVELIMWNCNLKDESMQYIVKLLELKQKSENISLFLGDNLFSNVGIQELTKSIAFNQPFNFMKLSFYDSSLTQKQLDTIFRLVTCDNIDSLELDIGKCNVDNKCIGLLAKKLLNSSIPNTLRINLAQNSFNDESSYNLVSSIAAMQKTIEHISLNFQHTSIGDQTAFEFAKLIKNNKVIKKITLNLRLTQITEIGLEKLREAIDSTNRKIDVTIYYGMGKQYVSPQPQEDLQVGNAIIFSKEQEKEKYCPKIKQSNIKQSNIRQSKIRQSKIRQSKIRQSKIEYKKPNYIYVRNSPFI